jgi:hypothetical protein
LIILRPDRASKVVRLALFQWMTGVFSRLFFRGGSVPEQTKNPRLIPSRGFRVSMLFPEFSIGIFNEDEDTQDAGDDVPENAYQDKADSPDSFEDCLS